VLYSIMFIVNISIYTSISTTDGYVMLFVAATSLYIHLCRVNLHTLAQASELLISYRENIFSQRNHKHIMSLIFF